MSREELEEESAEKDMCVKSRGNHAPAFQGPFEWSIWACLVLPSPDKICGILPMWKLARNSVPRVQQEDHHIELTKQVPTLLISRRTGGSAQDTGQRPQAQRSQDLTSIGLHGGTTPKFTFPDGNQKLSWKEGFQKSSQFPAVNCSEKLAYRQTCQNPASGEWV